MKRTIPYLLPLLLLPIMMKGQISVEPTSFVLTGNPSQTDIAYHVFVTNTSGQVLNLFWGKRMTGNPANWLSWICDNNLCYEPTVNSCPPSKPNVLQPGGILDLQVHMNPANTEGSADYELNVLDEEGNVLSPITGQILISTSTSIKENSANRLSAFPNPCQDYFQVSDTPGLKYVELFSIVGNKMKSYDALPQKQYYVGDLTDGMYLVRLLSSTGKVLKTIRLSKR